MLNLLQDLKYSFRLLLKQPIYTAIAILTIALGIGANSAIFSVVNTVLLKPLPYPAADRLVTVWESVPRSGSLTNVSAPGNVLDFQKENKSFEGVAAYTTDSVTLTGSGEPEPLNGLDVTPNFFAVVGIVPSGRAFLPEEGNTGNDGVAIISSSLWQRRFNNDPGLIGSKITIEGSARTIVGVLLKDFYFPDAENVDIVLPLALTANARGAHYLQVVGRLKDGVTLGQAQSEANTIAKRLEEAYPNSNVGVGMNLVSFREEIIGDIRPALLLLFGAVAFILLIACANVANLLLARAVSRQKEIALRTALGASRSRIIRQLLTESILLSLIGGGLGLFLAIYGIDALIAVGGAQIPHSTAIHLDIYVVGFTFTAALITGLIFGSIPAIQISKPNLVEALKSGGRGLAGSSGQNRSRNILIVAEIALSLMLLVGAGLMLRSFRQLQTVDLGFSPKNVLTVGFSLPSSRYNSGPNGQSVPNFYQRAIAQVKTLPGVESAGVAAWLPISGGTANRRYAVEGQPLPPPGSEPTAIYNIVSPEYFRALGVGLVKGRYFNEFDSANSPLVMIIAESTARKVFPNDDPIGKRISYYEGGTFRWREIVGVVSDIRHSSVRTEAKPETYVPHLQTPNASMTLLVRTSGDPSSAISGIRDQIRLIDKDLPLYDIRPMNLVISESLAKDRFNMLLMTIFAALALILAMVGVYGSMSYSVTQSTQEIGIRLALGGQPKDMLKLIIGQGMVLTFAGVTIGLAGAFLLARLMEKLLYQVSVTDPLTFVGIPLLLVGVALLACYVPGRRATRIDPMVALRYD